MAVWKYAPFRLIGASQSFSFRRRKRSGTIIIQNNLWWWNCWQTVHQLSKVSFSLSHCTVLWNILRRASNMMLIRWHITQLLWFKEVAIPSSRVADKRKGRHFISWKLIDLYMIILPNLRKDRKVWSNTPWGFKMLHNPGAEERRTTVWGSINEEGLVKSNAFRCGRTHIYKNNALNVAE